MSYILSVYNKSNKSKKEELEKQYPILKDEGNRVKIYLLGNKSDEVNLYRILEKYNDILKENLRTILLNNMDFLGEFFKEYKLLEKYSELETENSKKFISEKFRYPVKIDEEKVGDISLERLFSNEFLKELDIEKLAALNLFWQNRFTKEVKKINNAYNIIRELELYKKKNENLLERRGDSLLKSSLDKFELLNHIYNVLDLEMRGKIGVGKIKENEGFSEIDLEKELIEIDKHIYSAYNNKLYEMKVEEETLGKDFIKDIESCISAVNLQENVYINKENLIKFLLDGMKNKKNNNYGFAHNKIGKMVAFDIKGFNSPLRVHVFGGFERYKSEYSGISDFHMSDRLYLPTNILIPLSDNNKKALQEACKENKENSLLKHLSYIAKGGKKPENSTKSYDTDTYRFK